MTHKERLTMMISKLFIYFGNEIIESNIEIYVEFLEKYNDDLINQAYKHFIETAKFMPKVSEFIEYLEPRKDIKTRFDKFELIVSDSAGGKK